MKLGKILSVAFLSMALLIPAGYAKNNTDAFCNIVYQFAFTTEKNRQKLLPIYKAINLVDKNTKLSKWSKKTMKNIIIKAYEEPKYSSNEYQIEEETEFANGFYLQCIKGEMK